MSRKRRKINVESMLDEIRKQDNVTQEIAIRNTKSLWDTFMRNGKTGKKVIGIIPINLVHIDPRYQRTETFDATKANRIVSEYEESKMDIPKLAKREDGFYANDGQHRIYAQIIRGERFIEADLIEFDSYQAEVENFLEQDRNRNRLKPYDYFKGGLSIKRPDDVMLAEVCDEFHVQIVPRATKNPIAQLGSITTAKNIIHVNGKETLVWIFQLIRELQWEQEKRAYDSRTLRCLKQVYCHYQDEIDTVKQMLITALKEMSPLTLYAAAISSYPQKESNSAMFTYIADVVESTKGKAQKRFASVS